MKITKRALPLLSAALLLVLCAAVAGTTLAQPYPNRPIRMIAASAAGGGNDFAARIVGQTLTSALKQQVIIDNRGGAGGNIAAELAAKALPDGYTLVMVSASHAINPSLYRKISYDPVKDFAPITQVSSNAYVVVVHSSVPAKTVKELVALAKSKRGGIVYASTGSGSAGHLGMELLKTLAGFSAIHVPYKGGGPAIIDLLAGQVDASFLSPPVALPHVRNGKIRGLAVTSIKRSELLPDVPTVAESGFPEYEVTGWNGLLAPAGTPREVVAKLYEEVSRSLGLPDVRDRIVAVGQEPSGSTPEQFAAHIQAEIIKYEKVVKQSGARAD